MSKCNHEGAALCLVAGFKLSRGGRGAAHVSCGNCHEQIPIEGVKHLLEKEVATLETQLAEARAEIAINEVNIKNTKLRELAERTCGDGCHCMAENGGKCALRYLEMKE